MYRHVCYFRQEESKDAKLVEDLRKALGEKEHQVAQLSKEKHLYQLELMNRNCNGESVTARQRRRGGRGKANKPGPSRKWIILVTSTYWSWIIVFLYIPNVTLLSFHLKCNSTEDFFTVNKLCELTFYCLIQPWMITKGLKTSGYLTMKPTILYKMFLQ